MELSEQMMKTWLHNLVDKQFHELVYACISDPSEQDQLSKPFDRIEFLEVMKRWQRMERVEDFLHKYHKDKIPSTPELSQDEITFVNRIHERDIILRTYTHAYFAVDAPAGYGKTTLLNSLKGGFIKQKWFCFYIQLSYNTLESKQKQRDLLEKEILKTAIVAIDEKKEVDESSVEILFYQFVTEINKRASSGAGVAWLIDLEGKPYKHILEEKILHDIISETESKVRKGGALNTITHNPFRVVIAGRDIINSIKKSSNPSFELIRLDPFSYEVVRDSVDIHITNLEIDVRDQIAANLSYYTGGHPGCITKILEDYKDAIRYPEGLFMHEHQKIWDIVSRTAQNVWEGIDKDQKEYMLKLSVFRYIDHEVLSLFFNLEEDQEYDLADELTSTSLLYWDESGYLLRDDITRRLLSIYLRLEDRKNSSNLFKEYSCKAQEICLKQIANTETLREKWAIEYLFQVLQQNDIETIDNEQKREKITKIFYKEVDFILEELVKSRPQRRCHKLSRIFVSAMQKDWEFKFTVNYYLKENSKYTEQPYHNLRDRIDAFFRC